MAGSGSSDNGSVSDAILCANYCGFYGTPEKRNLCSVCYAAYIKETGGDSAPREAEASGDVVVRSTNLGAEISPDLGARDESSASASASSGSEGGSKDAPAAAKTKSRCTICKKKVGLLGFKCGCGGLFCGKHRHPEEHSCGVDRKAIGREALKKQLVECKPDKLEFRV